VDLAARWCSVLRLVVLNTVEAARAVYQALRGGPTECTLLHSRFRALERAAIVRHHGMKPGVQSALTRCTPGFMASRRSPRRRARICSRVQLATAIWTMRTMTRTIAITM
jgi:hypothetical protein